jgi:four helix bundle protein
VVFPKEETFSLVSQLKRCSSSIPTNIAEGTGRFTQKDFAGYLQNALGSSHELEYLLILSNELNFIDKQIFDKLFTQVNEIKAMLISLIQKVRKL